MSDKVFKSGPSKIWRTASKTFEAIWSASNFLKAVLHKFYLVHSSLLNTLSYVKLCNY